MNFNQKAHPDCVYSDNPFHECASACLEKIAQGHVKKTKKQGLKALIFSGSFGRKKKESYSESLSPLSAKPYQNGGGSFGNGNFPKVHHAVAAPVAVKNKTVSDRNKSFSSSSSDDFFKHRPEKKLSQIIPLSQNNLVDKSKAVSPKPGKQERKIEAGSETTLFNFLSPPTPHGKESSDDYSDDDDEEEEENNNNEIGVELDLESVMSDTIVSVGKYRVRSGLAAILRAIIEKHGDIAQNCKLESGSMRSRYLECLCSLMQELKSIPVGKLTKVKVKEMLAVLKDLESVDIEVAWLRLVLEEFARSQEDVETEKGRQEGLLKAKREDLKAQEADLVRMEEEVAEARLRIEETRAMMVEMESEWVRMEKMGFKMEKFKGKTFIDELL